MKHRLGKLLLAASGAAALAVSAGSIGLASYIMHGKRQTLDEAKEWQDAHYDTSWYEDLEKTNYEVAGYDGYVLHVQLCRNPQPSGKYVIITHGYTDNRFGMLKYMKLYLDRGYHCIIYDLRGHGINQPFVCTYGTLEGKDLFELILDTRKRYEDIEILGLHGESLGSATTVTALGYVRLEELRRQEAGKAGKAGTQPDGPAEENRKQEFETFGRDNAADAGNHTRYGKSSGLLHLVDFAVADCGFADIENVLRGVMKHQGNPQWLVDLASAGAKVRYGYALKDMRPIDWLYGNQIPVLFIHGAQDTFILPSNSERMAKATGGYSECHLIPGAKHAESVLIQPKLYREYLYAFLDKCE